MKQLAASKLASWRLSWASRASSCQRRRKVRSHSLRSSPTTCPEAMRQRPSGRLPRPRRCSTALRLTCTRGTASMARRGATLQERAPLQSGALAVAAQAQERPCARVSRARACQLDSCCFVLVRAPRSPLSPGRVYGLCSARVHAFLARELVSLTVVVLCLCERRAPPFPLVASMDYAAVGRAHDLPTPTPYPLPCARPHPRACPLPPHSLLCSLVLPLRLLFTRAPPRWWVDLYCHGPSLEPQLSDVEMELAIVRTISLG